VSQLATITSPNNSAEASASYQLPDQPLVVIEPSGIWVGLNLKDLWLYRELLLFLTWRDIQVRYKQTVLGAAWAIIQPLFTMIVFTLFFGKLAGLEAKTGGIPYSIFAYAGLLPWMFFSNAVTNSGNSLVGSANLITKVYFPRMIIPAASVGAGLVDFAIAFVILFVLMAYYGVALSVTIVILPVLVLLTTLLAIAVGMWFSALNVKYRDIRYALPFVIQLWMFVSPVIYPPSLVPERYRWLLFCNPLTGIIDGYRSALFGQSFDWLAIGISAAIILALLIYSAYNFRRMERTFADVV
jgi:lipopolysaccharide transport system permease protein